MHALHLSSNINNSFFVLSHSALLSQKSFNEKLLQSLLPDDLHDRDEHIQVSLDEFDQLQ